jgi:hypothetical protein
VPAEAPMGVLDPDAVSTHGSSYGWYEHDYQWSQGELVILRKADRNGDSMQLNVWCTTGTVGSYLNHPAQGKTQLFRREVDSLHDLCAILENPRVHTGDGYHRKRNRPQEQARELPCPGCGRKFKVMSSVAGHFESGSCHACPGRDAARRAAYGFVRRQEQTTGLHGALTGNTQPLLTWSGQADYTAGYDSDGQNYECPGCSRAFRTLQGLMSHCEAKPQCRSSTGGHGMLQLTFR